MDSIKFDYSKICNFVTKEEMIALYPEARQVLILQPICIPWGSISSKGCAC